MISQETIQKEYFEWMSSLVVNNKYAKNLSFKKLFKYLNQVEFTPIIDNDINRAIDGRNLRYRFGYIYGYTNDTIRDTLDIYPCSVFEMIIALSYRLEEQIMDNYDYGDRTSQWFWNMIVSLGLGNMSDDKFSITHTKRIVQRFLNREYKPNGEGGLFTLNHDEYDLRNEEIWYQAMWYLDENFDFSL